MKVHELCLAFPEMRADQYRTLADDIVANGLNRPIVVYEDQILDGRHRYRACQETGVEPRFETFDGPDPVAYVFSENGARRHLTPSQLAHAIAAMKPFEERRARERMAAGGASKGMANLPYPIADVGTTADKLAEKVGVSERTIRHAIKVREHGTEELNAAVAAGEMSVSQAEKIVTLNPDAQRKIVNTPKEQRAAEIRSALNRSDACKRRDARKKAAPMPELPSTQFVRRFLAGVERVAIVCAEDGERDGAAIATRFLAEMDWGAQGLALQWERCEPVFRALAIVQQSRQKAA